MKNILSRFTKQIHITQFFNCMHPLSFNLDVEKVASYFMTERNKKTNWISSSANPTNFYKIVISDHAFRRWNERVSLEDKKRNLQNRMNALNDLGRISLFYGNIGLIDNEVLFTYESNAPGIMVITTFYGRISQNPTLNQFEALRNYNAQFDEFASLSLDKELIADLLPPPIPVTRMSFEGDTTSYMLEQYNNSENTLFILIVMDGPDKGHVREIYLHDPSCSKIEKSVRQALIMMGHEQFVFEHISTHYPDALKKRMDKVAGKDVSKV
jgi:hypothetical protein